MLSAPQNFYLASTGTIILGGEGFLWTPKTSEVLFSFTSFWFIKVFDAKVWYFSKFGISSPLLNSPLALILVVFPYVDPYKFSALTPGMNPQYPGIYDRAGAFTGGGCWN